MTTPRDDIAGLIARLRDSIIVVPSYGKCLRMSLQLVDVEAAATQLDALSAREKNAIHDRDNAIRLQDMLESEAEKLSARVKELEVQLAAARKSLDQQTQMASEQFCRSLRLQQERNEAYERLAAMNGMSPDEWAREKAIAHAAMTPEIEDAIRRLASGPEKEKKG